MTEELKAYYEAKVMQSFGYLDSSVNPVEYADEKVKEESESKESKESNSKDIENHMVIGEYYEGGE